MDFSRRLFLKTLALIVPSNSFSQMGKLSLGSGDSTPLDQTLSFQTGAFWSPRVNLNADTVFAYGIGDTLPERIASWRSHGYRTDVMTGIAWGVYKDYLDGKFDGQNHEGDAQTNRLGEKVRHGSGRGAVIYYMVPTQPYVRFIEAGLKRAVDAGAEAICLEEPEFWAQSGYSESFKREWQSYYHEAWQPPDSTEDAQYRASKLKYYLYRRALSEAFGFVHSYASKKGRRVGCYVASHSLPNYSQWRIVSPESSLEQVDCDGYIAQVWTGTSRTPNVYEGKRAERTFETAFLEYGAVLNLSNVSGRAIWLLNDPVEDNPNHTWTDYRKNWENTMTASLLHPAGWRYEVMPWPDRVFGHKYPVKLTGGDAAGGMVSSLESGNGYPSATAGRREGPPAAERSLIPQSYATELQAVIRALKDMRQPASRVHWEQSGTAGTGILISDTMMFQRGDPHPSDANLGSFYGLALPLLMRGIPIMPVQIEYAHTPDFLKSYKLLLLTYEGQKPPHPRFHQALAQWVRGGGALVMMDDDQDPYNAVREWWNTHPNAFASPRLHLFKTLGLDANSQGLHHAGEGVVLWHSRSPAALSYDPTGANFVANASKTAAEAVGLGWRESRVLVLRRGPYLIAAGLDAPDSECPAARPLHGRYINLFDPNLPLLKKITVAPGQRFFLLDAAANSSRQPRILAAACRITGEAASRTGLQFHASGIGGTQAVVCVALPRHPKLVLVDGRQVTLAPEDHADGTWRIRFPNSVAGVSVKIAL